ncbi:hypothetical protein GUITHDRAFT_163089, partial [Guillardia theta CCMP2712]
MAVALLRATWLAVTCAMVLLSDGKGSKFLRYLNDVSYYGKLSSLQDKEHRESDVLKRVYIGARTVWIAYYAWGFILNTFFVYTSASTSLICLEVHLFRRLYESVFVTKFSADRKEHPITIMIGLFFYSLVSVSFVEEERLLRDSGNDPSALSGFRLVLIAFFFLSMACQHMAHVELASLRSMQQHSSVYVVPSGWLFRNVSTCPHYTAEVMMALFHGLYFNCSWLILAFTVTNLSITAVRTRRWYRTLG